MRKSCLQTIFAFHIKSSIQNVDIFSFYTFSLTFAAFKNFMINLSLFQQPQFQLHHLNFN